VTDEAIESARRELESAHSLIMNNLADVIRDLEVESSHQAERVIQLRYDLARLRSHAARMETALEICIKAANIAMRDVQTSEQYATLWSAKDAARTALEDHRG